MLYEYFEAEIVAFGLFKAFEKIRQNPTNKSGN